MYWLCGKSHEECVTNFGGGQVGIQGDWEHLGVVETAFKPKSRPPEYGLHGVHRMVCCGCTGVCNALQSEHDFFGKKKSSEWTEFYLDPIRIRARTVTAEDVVGEKKDGVHIEQSAAGEWVKAEGWDCIADEPQKSHQLQHDI